MMNGVLWALIGAGLLCVLYGIVQIVFRNSPPIRARILWRERRLDLRYEDVPPTYAKRQQTEGICAMMGGGFVILFVLMYWWEVSSR